MKRLLLLVAALMLQPFLMSGAMAQGRGAAPPVDQTSDGYPSNIKVQKGPDGFAYVDAQGRFLYAVDSRGLRLGPGGQGGQGAQGAQGGGQGGGGRGQGVGGPGSAAAFVQQAANCNGTCAPDFCTATCADDWSPLLAPADAQPVGKWKVVKGPEGPQWTFNGDFVFAPKNGVKKEPKPDSTAGGAFDLPPNGIWKKLPYIPPLPKLVTPVGVKPLYVGTAYSYVLTDAKGHALYTAKAKPGSDWVPLGAGAVAQNLGDWTVNHDSDHPQWLYHGKPVYVSQEDKPTDVPAAGLALHP